MTGRTTHGIGWRDLARSVLAGLVVLSVPAGVRAGERFYVIVFAYQGEPPLPRNTHTFATFVRATGEGARPENHRVEAHTISWAPASGAVRAARLLPERGANLDLAATLRQAHRLGSRVSRWGPFQVQRELYERALGQIARLESGAVAYKVLDSLGRPCSASNCIHAVSDMDADRGLLVTGLASGAQASLLVVQHFRRWMVNQHLSHEWIADRLGLCGLVVARGAWRW
jgi:hypothetical protein